MEFLQIFIEFENKKKEDEEGEDMSSICVDEPKREKKEWNGMEACRRRGEYLQIKEKRDVEVCEGGI